MRIRRLFLLSILFVPGIGGAQELSFLAGRTESAETDDSSYAWQIDLRYDLAKSFALSASWINEGHLEAHRRDGIAGRLWGRIPLFDRKVFLSFGGGIYRYFDTQPRPGGDHENVHGWAPVYGMETTYYAASPWFVRLGVNHIHPPGEIDTNQVLLGAGYRLWKGSEARGAEPPPGSDALSAATGSELALLLGETVHNSLEHDAGFAAALEFRRGISPHLDWTLSLLNEDTGGKIRRSGLGSQLWLVDTVLGRRLALGIGAGVYAFVDRNPPSSAGRDEQLDFAGLASLTAGWRFADRWRVRFNWYRVVSNGDRDSDVFVLGAGFLWPR